MSGSFVGGLSAAVLFVLWMVVLLFSSRNHGSLGERDTQLSSSSRYSTREFLGSGTKIECYLHGSRVGFDEPADCHGKPPFWRWWHDYRNCYASNVCVLRGKLEVFHDGGEMDALARHKSLACENWVTTNSYEVVLRSVASLPGPTEAIWHDEPSLHSSRVLPGHFGHDILNTLFYGFETFARANLTEWLVRSDRKRPSSFATERDPVESELLDVFFDYTQYGPRSDAWSRRHCFKLAMLSSSHSLDMNLVFRRSSPTRYKKQMWKDYRDVLLRRILCNVLPSQKCDDLLSPLRKRRSLSSTSCDQLRITVLQRSTKPGSSNVLTANGRGRRIVNDRELVSALRSLGAHVVEADPGRMSLHDQQTLMLETDVLISRMGSSVVNAMFMPPGGLCIEIEAADPAHLYYDHPSTFEELAEIFDHDFVRSTHTNESEVERGVVAGGFSECCEECRGPKALAKLVDKDVVKQCCARCKEFGADRLAGRRQQTGGGKGDDYYRRNWYMNWWLSDCPANVAEIIDLVKQHCSSSSHGHRQRQQQRDSAARSSSGTAEIQRPLPAPRSGEKCAYVPSPWENDWFQLIRARESDKIEWTAGCEAMKQSEGIARRYLDWIASNRVDGAPTDIFSTWANCPGSHAIEPLVGHLRHPYFHCVGPRKDTYQLLFSTDYLLLATSAGLPDDNESYVKFFFDAGASVVYDNCWAGCTKWFVDAYARRGIDFDRILLWEAAIADPKKYWKSVPADLVPKMQYYNTPLTVEPPDNLWHAVRALAKPEDFVVVKIDVDNYELEVSLVNQLLASPDLINLVDELFWEHHVNGSPIRKTRVSAFNHDNLGWGDQVPHPASPDSHLHDSYRLFTELRRHGIRAHSWI